MKKYKNDLLGLSRTELKKEWENCWDRIQKLNPIRDYKELEELNKRFDKCVEAYYAVDCGDHWKVTKASKINGYTQEQHTLYPSAMPSENPDISSALLYPACTHETDNPTHL